MGTEGGNNPSGGKTWHPARLAELTRLWNRGLTGTQIAAIMGGGLTKNAVIGAAHRADLIKRPSPIPVRDPNGPRRHRQSVTVKAEKPKPAPVATPEPDLLLLVLPKRRVDPMTSGAAPFQSLVAAGVRCCLWIDGPTVRHHAHEAMCCGERRVPGSQWCEVHRVRAIGRAATPSGNLAAIDNWSPVARAGA